MRFVNPEFLFALTALAIPVIIHLFNFRRYKKVYFSNLSFLKEVREQTQSRSRLKHLLVLFSRILALTFLVLAFAQPYIPGSHSDEIKGDKLISIYIDNSFSMDIPGKNGILLENAKRKAIEVAGEYAATDQFQLVTNDFESWQQRLMSREEFIETAAELKASASSPRLSEVLLRQLDVLNSTDVKGRRIVWISDFQKSTADLASLSNKETPKVICIPIQAQKQSNLYIDSVWFATPVRQLQAQEKLVVRIRNAGNETAENIPLRLDINGSQKSLSMFSVEGGSYCDSTLTFTNTAPGIQQARVTIGDAHLAFDDDWFFSFKVENSVNILSLHDAQLQDTGTAVSRLFYKDPFYKHRSRAVSSVDFSELSKQHLIILNGLSEMSSGLSSELKKFMDAGGNVVLFPAMKSNLTSLNTFLTSCGAAGFLQSDTSVTAPEVIDTRNPFFARMFEREPREIDLPLIKFRYRTENRVIAAREQLWRMRNGEEFISRYANTKGFLYVCTVPLNEKAGNFSRHALFVPVLLRIAEWSQNSGIHMQTIGKDEPIEVRGETLNNDQPFEISNEDQSISIIPETRTEGGSVSLFAHGQIHTAGNYFIRQSGNLLSGSGFNYNRLESDPACFTVEELQKGFEQSGLKEFSLIENAQDNIPLSLESIDNSSSYWKLCIVLALVFLLAEVLLLRFMKS